MRWTVHGERSLYESEWLRLVLVDVEIPGGERFEHHVVRMPEPGRGHDRARSRSRRAVAVASPLHHRHVGLGDPGRPHRSRRDARSRPRRGRRSRRPAGSRARCARSCATSRRTACRIRCSTSSSPTARRTSASRPTPASPSASSGSSVAELRRLVQDGQMLDGLSLTAVLYALAFGELVCSEPNTPPSHNPDGVREIDVQSKLSRARTCGRRPRPSSTRTRRARPRARARRG